MLHGGKMKTQNLQRHYYADRIKLRLAADLRDLDVVQMGLVNEVTDALALGCTLAKPRRFDGELMSAQDFRQIADTLTFEGLAVAVQALTNNRGIHNRLWYALGVLTRSRATKQRKSEARNSSKNFDERDYSAAECAQHVTGIDDITDDEL